MKRLLVGLAAWCIATPALAQSVDRVAINGIIDQGLNHSEVMQTAAYLTDRIGGRMTNSPQMRQAEQWSQQQFRDWGCRTCALRVSSSDAAGPSFVPAPA